MKELWIYLMFGIIEFTIVSFVSIGNYLAWLSDESDRTGLPARQLFSWYSCMREFSRAQTIGFSIGLISFALSASFLPVDAIKEAFLAVAVGCLSAHFHRDIAHVLRVSLPETIARFIDRRRSVPLSNEQLRQRKIDDLERALILETRTEEQFRLRELIREMRESDGS